MQTDNYRIATKGTDYAKGVKNHSGHLYVEKEKNKWFTGNTYFWLRTIGAEQVKASVVYEYGYLHEHGVYVDARDCGVRPCMWISVNGAKASSTKEENKKDSNDEETKKKNNKVEEKNDSSKSNSTDNYLKNIKDLKLASTYDEDTTDKKMDSIKFGKSKNGEDIEWIVLYRDDKKALLLTKYLSVVNPYFEDDNINNVNKKATWETSTIREWLNTKYYNETFSNSEKEYIILSKLETTSDNVFLLSVDEVNKYLKKTKARSSDFASADSWWLRTTGQDEKFAAFVKNDGKIDEDGAFINSDKSTRPAIWVSLTGSVSSKETSLENKKENKEELKNETKEKTTNEKDNKDEKNANNNDEYFTGWDEGHYYKDGKEYSLEWLNEDGKWYYLTENGTYAKDGWLNIENDYYYFNKDGTLAADQWIVEKTKLADGKTMVDSYYVGLDGKMWRNAITPDGFTVDANGLYREYK